MTYAPRHIPNYTVAEAAHYLRMSASTLRSWTKGWSYPTQEGRQFSEPLIVLPDPDQRQLSFANLVEAHVLLAIRQRHGVPMQTVRPSLDFVRERLGHERPLLTASFATDGVSLFVDHLGSLINASQDGQAELREALEAFLERIERDEHGLAARLFPFTRAYRKGREQPRLVLIDPEVSFGRPVLVDTRVPTAEVHDRFQAGDPWEDLAEDFGIGMRQIQEALRYESRELEDRAA